MSEAVSPLQGEPHVPSLVDGYGYFTTLYGPSTSWQSTEQKIGADREFYEKYLLRMPDGTVDDAGDWSEDFINGALRAGASVLIPCAPPASSLDLEGEEAKAIKIEFADAWLAAQGCHVDADNAHSRRYLDALKSLRNLPEAAVEEETREWTTEGTYGGYSTITQEGMKTLRITVPNEFFKILPLGELGSCTLTLRREED